MRASKYGWLMGVFLFAGQAWAQQGFQALSQLAPTDSPEGMVEVVEFFWYGCPHCNQFAPMIHDWESRKPKNVNFKLVAAPLNKSWNVHSRAYYAAEALGVVPHFHMAMFDAIHRDKRAMNTEAEVVEFAGRLGIDRKVFSDAMNSFAVDTQLRRAVQLARAYQITGVPTIGVAGKYRTSAQLAQGYPNMINVLNQLVARESQM